MRSNYEYRAEVVVCENGRLVLELDSGDRGDALVNVYPGDRVAVMTTERYDAMEEGEGW